MQAKVPKFLEIEDKIMFGLSWRQFLELGATSLVIVFAFAILTKPLAVAISFTAAVAGITMAFIKINGRSAHHFIFSLWSYFFNPRQYVWRKEEVRAKKTKVRKMEKASSGIPHVISPQRLKEIALMLDVAQRFKR